jgi:hypothetical protein
MSECKAEKVGRKEFLEMCRAVAVLPSGVCGIKDAPPSLWVKYQDMTFYPVGYKLTYTEEGKPLHTAILHDLKVNSIIECELSKVSKWSDEK